MSKPQIALTVLEQEIGESLTEMTTDLSIYKHARACKASSQGGAERENDTTLVRAQFQLGPNQVKIR